MPVRGAAWSAIADVKIGQTYTFGGLTIENGGKRPVAIERVEVIHVDPGATIVGVLLSEGAPYGTAIGFPPEGARLDIYRPATGAVVMPRSTPQGRAATGVSVGIRANNPGAGNTYGVRVFYTSAGKSYVRTYPEGMTVCVPDSCTTPPIELLQRLIEQSKEPQRGS